MVTIQHIQEVVAKEYGVTVEGIKSKVRVRTLIIPRHAAMYLCREMTEHSLKAIGRHFSDRDHTTVIHGINRAVDIVSPEQMNKLRELALAQSMVGKQ